MKILLVNPPLRSITNTFGVGFQLPLGLVMVGGPLVDAGHTVTLVDADAMAMTPRDVARFAAGNRADAVLVGHSGSTAANPASIEIFRAIKAIKSTTITVYGGVYPTYAAEVLLEGTNAIDVIVRGEGEETVVDLFRALSNSGSDLSHVKGISWREGAETIRRNPDRPPIADLDQYRVAWELADWSLYSAFGVEGAAAGIQFSRGCPRTCTYCGQWSFWKQWRHRSIRAFAEDIQLLHDSYDVHALWIADENWGDDPDILRQILSELSVRRLNMAIYCSMCASDVARDLPDLALYREAGIRFILMGIESDNEKVLKMIRKDNPHMMVKNVVDGLRQNGILSVVNYIFGLRPESHSSMGTALLRVLELDADFLNALYFTPHGWTAEGKKVNPDRIIQVDQRRWSYRNQVLDAGGLGPWQLLCWVKFIEFAAHVRPRAMYRLFRHSFSDLRRYIRWCYARTACVWFAEIADALTGTHYRRPGPIDAHLIDILLPRTSGRSARTITQDRQQAVAMREQPLVILEREKP
jgi:anaerobic magnesium-protoporphyrin IX monomethyl ester cyclase